MMALPMRIFRRLLVTALLYAAVAATFASPANARVFFGIGIPFYGPGYYPPPVYYPPPPVYYPPPPPVVYAPPPTYAPPPPFQSGPARSCHAEAYVCPMDRPVPPGASCYCASNGGQRVWGRAY